MGLIWYLAGGIVAAVLVAIVALLYGGKALNKIGRDAEARSDRARLQRLTRAGMLDSDDAA